MRQEIRLHAQSRQQRGKQADDNQQKDKRPHIAPFADTEKQNQQRGENKVKLFFQRQRPDVLQRLFRRIRIKIAAAAGKEQVGGKQQGIDGGFDVLAQIERQKENGGNDRRAKQYAGKDRQNAFGASFIKLEKRKAAVVNLAADNGRNQVSRQHEKHIHAQKTARQPLGIDMKYDDG